MTEALREMRSRPKCNRVSGCPATTTLLSAGHAATPLVAQALAERGPRDAPWIGFLIELLGQLDDPRAIPTLVELLDQPRWEYAARAAHALGRLALPEARPAVDAALARARAAERPNAAVVGALLYAQDRLADRAAPGFREASDARRAELLAFLDGGPEELARLNPAVYALALEIVRDWRLSAALPAARLAGQHPGRFVRYEALKTMARLQDTGGIPVAMRLLDDSSPGVRRQAVATLQAITGATGLTDAEAWRAWCERHDCMAP